MDKWTVDKIRNFYTYLNERYGFDVNPNIIVEEKNKYPLCRRNFNNLVFVPDFFNHEAISEDARKKMLLCLYSCFHFDKNKNGHLDISPGFLTKGICDDLGFGYVTDAECEVQERTARRNLYDDIKNGCYFSIGDKLRESTFRSYEVVDICRKSSTETIITVKPIGCHQGEAEKIFSEEELFNRCCKFFDFENFKIDMRKNIFVLSGPSGTGKSEVFSRLKKICPDISKTVSVTTREPRSNETEGVDYYFISTEEFYDYQMNNSLVEYELYDSGYYGTFFSEVERHSAEKPLFIFADVRNRRNILMHYPLAKSLFIMPSSLEELEKRLRLKGIFFEEEIKNRLAVAADEMKEKNMFDFVFVNDDSEKCAEEIKATVFPDYSAFKN